METKFKINDKVKLIENTRFSCNKINDIGIIIKIFTTHHKHHAYRVKVENRQQISNWSNESDLELFEEKDVFKLPKIWYVIVTKENQDVLSKWRGMPYDRKLFIGYLTGICVNNRGDFSKEHNPADSIKSYNFGEPKIISGFNFGNEITFKQFKKYVLNETVEEPKELPFFKILKQENNKILEVQNNEGNVFFIGDKVKSLSSRSRNVWGEMTILRFRKTKDKLNVCAITKETSENGIGIDKLEHIIEPEFILPEKWCILNNNPLIGNYFNKILKTQCYTRIEHINNYLHSHNQTFNPLISTSEKLFSFSNVRTGFTLITSDQFKKYVLKE